MRRLYSESETAVCKWHNGARYHCVGIRELYNYLFNLKILLRALVIMTEDNKMKLLTRIKNIPQKGSLYNALGNFSTKLRIFFLALVKGLAIKKCCK